MLGETSEEKLQKVGVMFQIFAVFHASVARLSPKSRGTYDIDFMLSSAQLLLCFLVSDFHELRMSWIDGLHRDIYFRTKKHIKQTWHKR